MYGKNKSRSNRKQSGIALVIVLLFITVFSTLAVGMFRMSTNNVVAANNFHHGNAARAVAESGLELLRYIMDGTQVSGSDSTTKLYSLYGSIQERLEESGMSNVAVAWDGNGSIQLSNITLDTSSGENVTIYIQQDPYDDDVLIAQVTGTHSQFGRTIRANFDYVEHAQSVFDFGIATKGPLLMSGQTSVSGVNLAVESDVFIDTDIILGDSFNIGNQASVAGDVHIVNDSADYTIGSQSSVGGEIGTAAEDHIFVGVDPVEFPVPDTEYFRQYATGDIVDSSTDISNYDVLNNVIIAANTNPTFASNIQINGVLFIEQPNDVSFAGQVDITGIIVGSSEVGESVGSLDFSGQVECFDVSTLEGSEFDGIKSEDGTFIMAPGFSADFTGQANVINGVIAIGGARFTGQAGGTINGSIINYSEEPLVLQGQSELLFNRSGTTQNPAGFQAVQILEFDSESYSEVIL